MILLLIAALAAGAAALGEEPAPVPVDVTVYFSKEDPHWSAAEKILDAVARKYAKQIKLAKVSIDSPAGYKQLADAERALKISERGEITLVFGPLFLTSQGERRHVEKYADAMIARILGNSGNIAQAESKAGKERLVVDVKAQAAEIFGKDATLELLTRDAAEPLAYHRVLKDGKRAGYIVDAYRHIACSMCNDVQFLLAVGLPERKVIAIRPTRNLERFGAKLEEPDAAAFLGQFKGRTPSGAAVKVDIISHATTTSRVYEAVVAEILKEIERLEKK